MADDDKKSLLTIAAAVLFAAAAVTMSLKPVIRQSERHDDLPFDVIRNLPSDTVKSDTTRAPLPE